MGLSVLNTIFVPDITGALNYEFYIIRQSQWCTNKVIGKVSLDVIETLFILYI